MPLLRCPQFEVKEVSKKFDKGALGTRARARSVAAAAPARAHARAVRRCCRTPMRIQTSRTLRHLHVCGSIAPLLPAGR